MTARTLARLGDPARARQLVRDGLRFVLGERVELVAVLEALRRELGD